MHPLLTTSFWFSLNPPPFLPWVERVLLITFIVLFVAGIVVWMLRLRGGYTKPMKRALSRLASHLGWTGIVGLLLWGISYERIPWFSVRILFALWGVWFVLGLWLIVRYVWKEIPAIEARAHDRAVQQKWLPKRKK